MGVLGADRGGFGCNILILPVDASVLRPSGGSLGAVKMLFRRVCRPHLPAPGEIGRDCKFTTRQIVDAAPMPRRDGANGPSGMDKAGRFRHEKTLKRRTLPPAGGLTQKVKQFQWFLPIP